MVKQDITKLEEELNKVFKKAQEEHTQAKRELANYVNDNKLKARRKAIARQENQVFTMLHIFKTLKELVNE